MKPRQLYKLSLLWCVLTSTRWSRHQAYVQVPRYFSLSLIWNPFASWLERSIKELKPLAVSIIFTSKIPFLKHARYVSLRWRKIQNMLFLKKCSGYSTLHDVYVFSKYLSCGFSRQFQVLLNKRIPGFLQQQFRAGIPYYTVKWYSRRHLIGKIYFSGESLYRYPFNPKLHQRGISSFPKSTGRNPF